MDMSQDLAIVFGNEKDGVSQKILDLCDGNLSIPMFGMVQSLNVSNAAAIILFEAVRQRIHAGKYNKNLDSVSELDTLSMTDYVAKSRPRVAKANADMLKQYVEGVTNKP
jgi:tRNA (guanosine-2'-O-)-methyltransferase